MPLHKKDYELVAQSVRDTTAYLEGIDIVAASQIGQVFAHDLACKFVEDNEKFDTARFLEACGASDKPNQKKAVK